MAFPPEFLDEIRVRAPLSETVGRRVKLRRRGREHTGLCPFHNEKTPSFTVSEEKGFFHCFGCGAHGDVMGFVMRIEGLSFPEAVERLAAQAGLQVPRASPEERAAARRRADLFEVLEAACAWFEIRLAEGAGADARAYLERRGLRPETIAAFRIGYAPGRSGLLRAALKARDMDDDQLAEAGLIKQVQDGRAPRDFFVNRIVFPITDRRGRVIAFGGRALGNSPAKYLNSPDTALFHKGKILYNLARARQAALETRELIVVEGYMDVIALSQVGFPAAVAPLGTAMTAEQIAELWRLAEEPVLCLDGDEAGRRAGFRAAERALALLKPGYSLSFAVLPQGEDPDSLIREGGASALREVLEAARPLSDLIWLMETEGRRFGTPERQAGLIKALNDRIGKISDATIRTAYGESINRRFQAAYGYDPWGPPARSWSRSPGHGKGRYRVQGRAWGRPSGGIGARLRDRPRDQPWGAAGLNAHQAPELLRRRKEQVFLATLVTHPELIAEFAEILAEIELSSARNTDFCRLLVDLLAEDPSLDTVGLKGHLTDQGFSKLFADILSSDVYVHGGFARPGADLEQARNGVQEILDNHQRRQAASEIDEAGRNLAESTTEESLAKLEAKRKLARESHTRWIDLDGLAPAGRGEAK